MSEKMRDAIISELRHTAGKLINGEISDGDIAASLLSEAAELLASSPAQEPVTTEPVAWTNEAQLGFLKEPGYRVVPMAMWAFQHSAHPIALYAIPAPPQHGERTREEAEQEIVLLAERITELLRQKDILQAKIVAARTTLEEIAALGTQASSNDNAIRMGNIAHAAWIKLGLTGEEGKS